MASGHGLLSASELGTLRRQALREVIAPCAAALCQRRDVAKGAAAGAFAASAVATE